MNKIDREQKLSDNEREIASRFARMRASEAASAPAFGPRLAPAKDPVRPAYSLPPAHVFARLAAGIAVVAIAVGLLRETPEEDPAALYAGIMASHQLQTDSLLIVSDSVLPALSDVPRLYELEAEFSPEAESH